MNAVSFDIMTLLNDNGYGTTGADLFAMAWGEGVDDQILIMDNVGQNSDLKELYEHPNFQIIVRGEKNADVVVTYNKIRAVHEFLIVQPTININGVDYLQFEPLGTVGGLGRDDNDRSVFSMNYYTFRDPI